MWQAGRQALPVLMQELESGNDIGTMIYQHLRRLSGQAFEDQPEPWLEWWRRQSKTIPEVKEHVNQ